MTLVGIKTTATKYLRYTAYDPVDVDACQSGSLSLVCLGSIFRCARARSKDKVELCGKYQV